MRLLLTGIEYAGKRTLGVETVKWWSRLTGEKALAPPSDTFNNAFHDHFTLPHVVHAIGQEHHQALSERQILTLNPGLLEQYQRYQMHDKLASGYIEMRNLFLIDWYYADAVYAPLYYGFGGPGEYGDRGLMARRFDTDVLSMMPDMILVLVKASPETIRQRVREGNSPFPDRHAATLFHEKDTEVVLERFEEEYERSLLRRKFVLDTTSASLEESLDELKGQIKPLVTTEDRLRILSQRMLEDW